VANFPDVGDVLPDIAMTLSDGSAVRPSDFAGRKLVIFFYPKDDTPGCTKEACAFQEMEADFSGADAVVIGVSKDSEASHDKFKKKYGLDFTLVSDGDGAICDAFGVWVEKLNYGKKYMGIERSTFLIDKSGLVRQVWRKVKVDGHAAKVLEAAKAL
jgi:peroxiredoxin Q/BCP